jgi:glutamate racemase
MPVDPMAGTRQKPRAFDPPPPGLRMDPRPQILVFDSGLGGLTVLAEIRKSRPDAALVYAADDAAFPYGRLPEPVLVARVERVVGALIAAHQPDLVCIACNTASTLVLAPLRRRFPALPFVGTVPAIKPAAKASVSKMISVLATPATVAREYTRELIREFAAGYAVELVGARDLARLAESFMQGETVSDQAIAREIAPCFQTSRTGRTDTIVLACTHYPLLIERLQALAPWPVTWIDPAPAIARRVDQVLREAGKASQAEPEAPQPLIDAYFTSGGLLQPSLELALRGRGLTAVRSTPLPLAPD